MLGIWRWWFLAIGFELLEHKLKKGLWADLAFAAWGVCMVMYGFGAYQLIQHRRKMGRRD